MKTVVVGRHTMRRTTCNLSMPLLLFALGYLPGRPAFVVPPSVWSRQQQPRERVLFTTDKGLGYHSVATLKSCNRRCTYGQGGMSNAVGVLAREATTELRMGIDNSPGSGGDGSDSAPTRQYSAWPSINRKAIGVMATAGALESAFLTYQKIKPGGLDLLCGVSGGCADVLSGPYSNFLGVPLSALGAMGYLFVALLALVPLFMEGEAIDKITRSLLLTTTTAMGVFSVYLLSLLKFKIGYPCPWCLTSAGLSLSMCGIAWAKKAVPEKTKAVVMGICTTLITAFACLTIFVVTETAIDIRQAEAMPGELSGAQLVAAPTTDTDSSPQAMRIGRKLKTLDAKMYGAYWCTHCFHQKELLGKQAMAKVKYVECSRRGVDNQADLCKATNLPGFPTWDIGGKLYPGEQSLEELEEIVGLDPFEG
ncbi:unnamed protein product [Ascophyllum nodosum]